MNATDLSNMYRAYIACLNKHDWAMLEQFVRADVIHNGQRIGLSGYRAMLVRDHDAIPDLSYTIELLVCESPFIASRLGFACTPQQTFLGLQVNGTRVLFSENVFYQVKAAKIEQVWSVIDKAAIEAQLPPSTRSDNSQ